MPDGFLEGYARLGGPSPALRDFLEAYDTLCDVLYHGTRLSPEPGEEGKSGKRYRTGYWFGDDSLLGVKREADLRMARLGENLRRWAEARARQAARRQGPSDHDREDLAGARGPGHHRPVGDPA